MRKNLLVLLSCLVVISCNKSEIAQIDSSFKTQEVGNVNISRAIAPDYFDWEIADWMPTPLGQPKISVPWIGQGSIAPTYGQDIADDYKKINGWELVYNTFTTQGSEHIVNPYFILYNKYRGIMRMYLYLTTGFISTSSYLEDALSINGQSSILNFLGDDITDCTQNKSCYIQIQPKPLDGSAPLASNKWYMMQYELAYDPNISSMSSDARLYWRLNYYDVSSVSLGGTQTGSINGTIGASASNMGSSLLNLAQTVGTGVLAGVGTKFITNNANDIKTGSNKLGLDNGIFKSLYGGISSALSSAAGSLPGAAIKVLSGIFGGSGSFATPVSLTLKTEIQLNGSITSIGSVPSSPISFYLPGVNIAPDVVGYIPLYNKPMGICNMSTIPSIDITYMYYDLLLPDDQFDPRNIIRVAHSDYAFPHSCDFSANMVYNPELLKIANVEIVQQSLVSIPYDYQGKRQAVSVDPRRGLYRSVAGSLMNQMPSSLRMGVRFLLKITPKDGSAPSNIVKTFFINHNVIDGDYGIVEVEPDDPYAPNIPKPKTEYTLDEYKAETGITMRLQYINQGMYLIADNPIPKTTKICVRYILQEISEAYDEYGNVYTVYGNSYNERVDVTMLQGATQAILFSYDENTTAYFHPSDVIIYAPIR